MRTYGFQGDRGEEFIVSVSLLRISARQKQAYKKALRSAPTNARTTQGLTVKWEERGTQTPNGERDSTVSYQSTEQYTSCEHNLFSFDRVAVITLVSNEPLKSAKLRCLKIVESLVWR